MLQSLNSKMLVKNTIYFSLFVQILTTLLSLHGFTIKLNKQDFILKQILGIETVVQIIEGCFYIWVIFALKHKSNLTKRRYIDWVITTPIMLLSSIIYMDYQYHKQTDNKILSLKQYIIDNKKNICIIIILNGCMLLFGYLGESNKLNKSISITIGFIFFCLSFYFIYNNYAIKTKEGKQLLCLLFIIWALYGIAAIMPFNTKNIMYNLLDIISKNFYGLFIYYKILQLK